MGSRGRFVSGLEVIKVWLAPVLRQFWIIVLIVTVGALAALAYGQMQRPGYEATAYVQMRPGVDVTAAVVDLTSRRNLLAMVQRHRLSSSEAGASLDRAAVLLRQAIAVRDMTSRAGQTLGLPPQTTGLMVSVQLADAEMAARVANDLAQQILDNGTAGRWDEAHADLQFYRREEERLWQESGALQGQVQAMAQTGAVDLDSTLVLDQRRLTLLRDQYDLVRRLLAEAEVRARRNAGAQQGRFSLLQRATATEAVSVLHSWMLVGVAGSLLLAVAMAFVMDRRYPGLQRGPWDDLAGVRRAFLRGYRVLDDPARPVFGVPRFVLTSAVLVVGLVGVAALIG